MAASNGQAPRREVDVAPAQPARLGTAHAGRRHDADVQAEQRVDVGGGLDESVDLARRRWMLLRCGWEGAEASSATLRLTSPHRTAWFKAERTTAWSCRMVAGARPRFVSDA